MSSPKSIESFIPENRQVLPFAEFIHLLEANGFNVGVDNYLSLQTLLLRIDPDCPQERLKKYLRPVFCTTPEEQSKFNSLFDKYFKSNLPKISSLGPSIWASPINQKLLGEEEQVSESNLIKRIIIGLLVFIVVLIILTYFGDSLGLDKIINDFGRTDKPETESQPVNNYLIPLGLILLGVVISIGGYLLYNRTRKKETLGLDMDRLRKPLLYWKMDVPETRLALFSSNAFFNTTRLLRSRELSEVRFLDVSKTIKATIENAGFPKFQYGFRTKFPEYLILIDRSTNRDHQANYFEALFQSLSEQEIYAERYFYRKTPHVCWDENNQGVELEELFRKYHSHRIVIMGDLVNMFDPMSGQLKKQLMPLLFWRYKAILTTSDPPAKFVNALNEYGEFITAKATIENLFNLQEAIQASEQIAYSSGASTARLNTTLEHLSGQQIIQKLKLKLDTTTFEWLCVCAVYPELNWAFTLYLGKQVLGEAQLTEERIMELVQLPWFRDGQFPEKLRGQLIHELSERTLQKTRQVIFDWMRENPPQAGDAKSKNDYQLFIAMEAAMLDPDNPMKQRWLQNQVAKPENQGSPYREIILHYIEGKERKETTLGLPSWMNRLFGVGDNLKTKEGEAEKVYKKANVGRRTIAKVIDWIAVILVIFIQGIFVVLSGIYDEEFKISLFLVFLLLQFYILPVLIDGATSGKGLGKRICGLILIQPKKDIPGSLLNAALRYLNILALILFLIFAFPLTDENLINEGDYFLLAGIFIVVYSSIEFLVVISYDSGRHLLDLLAGTQVVMSADYLVENKIDSSETTKSAPVNVSEEVTSKGVFLYPKADLDKKVISEVIDYFMLFVVIAAFAFLFTVIENFTILSVEMTNLYWSVVLLITFFCKVALDPLMFGVGKRQMQIFAIEIASNQKMSLAASFKKHLGFLLFILTLIVFININPSEFAYSIFWASAVVLLVLGFLQSVISKTGRSIFDKLAGTQEVNKKDFFSGNYEGNDSFKTPEFVQSKVAEQLPHDEAQKSQAEAEQFSFYTEEEIMKKVFELTNIEPVKSILIFSTSKQKTWLVSSGDEIFCLLDDAKTRSTKGRILQWRYKVKPGEQLYVNAKPSKRARLSGLLDVGNRRNWLYSYSLHPNTEKFIREVKELIISEAPFDESTIESNNIADDQFTQSEAPDTEAPASSQSFEQSQSTGSFSKEEPSTDWKDLSDSELIKKALNTKIEDAGNFLNELRTNDPQRASLLYQKINVEQIISLIDRWPLSKLGHVLNELLAIDQNKTRELYNLVDDDVLIKKIKELDVEEIGPFIRYLLDVDTKKTNELISKDEYLRSTLPEFERNQQENISSKFEHEESNIDQSSEGTINVEYIDLRIEYIGNMLQNDKIEEALENTLALCQEFGDESYNKTVLSLLGSYTKIKGESESSLLTKEDYEKDKSRIISATYDLLTQLKRDYDDRRGFKK